MMQGRRFLLILRVVIILAVLGGLVFILEHAGGGLVSRMSAFVAGQGRLGPVVFIAANALAIMFLLPQTAFSVTAGVLFGWKIGALSALSGMTIGAAGAFLVARYGIRDWLRMKYRDNEVFVKMETLSQSHPLHVLALSRLIPVIPFPVASYLLGITPVRTVAYVLMTALCMVPETLFLVSGGHLLKSGIVHGTAQWEVVAVLVVTGCVLAVVAHRLKKRFFGKADGV